MFEQAVGVGVGTADAVTGVVGEALGDAAGDAQPATADTATAIAISPIRVLRMPVIRGPPAKGNDPAPGGEPLQSRLRSGEGGRGSGASPEISRRVRPLARMMSQVPSRRATAARSTIPIARVGTLMSLRPETSRTAARAPRRRSGGSVGGDRGAGEDAGDAADQDGGGEAELEVTEEDVGEGGGADHGDGLGEVGADHLGAAQAGVEEEEEDDDQGAGADRGDAHDEADRGADGEGGEALDAERLVAALGRRRCDGRGTS